MDFKELNGYLAKSNLVGDVDTVDFLIAHIGEALLNKKLRGLFAKNAKEDMRLFCLNVFNKAGINENISTLLSQVLADRVANEIEELPFYVETTYKILSYTLINLKGGPRIYTLLLNNDSYSKQIEEISLLVKKAFDHTKRLRYFKILSNYTVDTYPVLLDYIKDLDSDFSDSEIIEYINDQNAIFCNSQFHDDKHAEDRMFLLHCDHELFDSGADVKTRNSILLDIGGNIAMRSSIERKFIEYFGE